MEYSVDTTVNETPIRRRAKPARRQEDSAPQPSGVAIEIKSYDELIAVINRRVEELQLSLSSVDQLAGLQENYISKCLRKHPVKRLGAVSGFCTFGALGLRLFFLQDDQATARTVSRRVPRKSSYVHRRDARNAIPKGSTDGYGDLQQGHGRGRDVADLGGNGASE